MSSLQLYAPTKRLCGDRREMLRAMSEGGRVGFDAPYQSRGCGQFFLSLFFAGGEWVVVGLLGCVVSLGVCCRVCWRVGYPS